VRDPPSEIYGYPLKLDAGETKAIAGPRNILLNKNFVTTFRFRRFLHDVASSSLFLTQEKRTRNELKQDENKLKNELEMWQAGTQE